MYHIPERDESSSESGPVDVTMLGSSLVIKSTE